jgi:hypothetical protein
LCNFSFILCHYFFNFLPFHIKSWIFLLHNMDDKLILKKFILWMISCILTANLIKSFHTMDEKYPLLRAIWVGNHGSLRTWPHFPWNHEKFP